MADKTDNITLTSSYALLVTTGDDFLLTLPRNDGQVEIVTMAAESAPNAALIGHCLTPAHREGLNRALSGPGYVYGRAPAGDARITLSHWTPA